MINTKKPESGLSMPHNHDLSVMYKRKTNRWFYNSHTWHNRLLRCSFRFSHSNYNDLVFL